MPNLKQFEWVGFLLLFVTLGYVLAVLMPGAAWSDFAKAETLAAVAAVVVALVLFVLRLLPARPLRFERFVFAVFLGGMPFIYVAAAWLQGDTTGIVVELVGIPLFVGLAAYGYFRSFWVVGVGIIAHGLGWDLWHHGTATYIAPWYPAACLLADLTLGFLALTQLSVQQVPNHSLQADPP